MDPSATSRAAGLTGSLGLGTSIDMDAAPGGNACSVTFCAGFWTRLDARLLRRYRSCRFACPRAPFSRWYFAS